MSGVLIVTGPGQAAAAGRAVAVIYRRDEAAALRAVGPGPELRRCA